MTLCLALQQAVLAIRALGDVVWLRILGGLGLLALAAAFLWRLRAARAFLRS